METSPAESRMDSYFPKKWPNGYPKLKDVSDTHIQRRTITKINHGRRTALERTVKSISLGVLNRFYVARILALTSAAVLTHNLFSPHEGFLTYQCYISENTKKSTFKAGYTNVMFYQVFVCLFAVSYQIQNTIKPKFISKICNTAQ